MLTYTLGVTSGTSGCSGMALLEQEREIFVASTYDEISEEAAQGGGLHIETLATLMGCEQPTEFTAMTQSKFNTIFADAPKSKELISRLDAEVQKDPALKASCTFQG